MKVKDLKISQIVVDQYGNKYEVVTISEGSKFYPVLIKCVDFKEPVGTGGYGVILDVGQRAWVLKDRSALLSVEEGAGKFFKENFYSSLALSNSLEQITVELSNGTKRHYLLGRQSTIDNITITLEDMNPVEDDCLTKDNIQIGMTVIDGVGNEYEVISCEHNSTHLSRTIEIITIEGIAKTIDVTVCVPFDDFVYTTKDFQIVKG